MAETMMQNLSHSLLDGHFSKVDQSKFSVVNLVFCLLIDIAARWNMTIKIHCTKVTGINIAHCMRNCYSTSNLNSAFRVSGITFT